MKQHKFLKEINGEKVFCLEYDKETLKDLCLEYQERYIRLHNIYNITLKKKKILMDERDRQEKLIARQMEQIKELEKRVLYAKDEEKNKEIRRLNDVIKEVKEYIIKIKDEDIQYTIGWVKQDILGILQGEQDENISSSK